MKIYKVAYMGEIIYLRQAKDIAEWTGISYYNIMNWLNKGVKARKYKIDIETIQIGVAYEQETDDNGTA